MMSTENNNPNPPPPPPPVANSMCCFVCHGREPNDSGPLLICGCACRGNEAKLCHIDCCVKNAKENVEGKGGPDWANAWTKCSSCKQYYINGFLRIHLGKTCKNFASFNCEESDLRYLYACFNLANDLSDGEQALAEHFHCLEIINGLRKKGGLSIYHKVLRVDILNRMGALYQSNGQHKDAKSMYQLAYKKFKHHTLWECDSMTMFLPTAAEIFDGIFDVNKSLCVQTQKEELDEYIGHVQRELKHESNEYIGHFKSAMPHVEIDVPSEDDFLIVKENYRQALGFLMRNVSLRGHHLPLAYYLNIMMKLSI